MANHTKAIHTINQSKKTIFIIHLNFEIPSLSQL